MNYLLISNIYLLVCALFGLVYGITVIFKNKSPIYFQLIVFAMASLVFSKVYNVVIIACYGGIPEVFNIGFIGIAAFLLFIFFSNYGQIDMLVDDRENLITKYRVIPVIIPVTELIISIFALFYGSVDISILIFYIVLSVIAGFAGYMNMKHLIIPDVKGGIVYSIRGFNLICIVIEILTLAEIGLSCFEKTQFIYPVQVLLGFLYIAVMPLLHREVRKWTQ